MLFLVHLNALSSDGVFLRAPCWVPMILEARWSMSLIHNTCFSQEPWSNVVQFCVWHGLCSSVLCVAWFMQFSFVRGTVCVVQFFVCGMVLWHVERCAGTTSGNFVRIC